MSTAPATPIKRRRIPIAIWVAIIALFTGVPALLLRRFIVPGPPPQRNYAVYVREDGDAAPISGATVVLAIAAHQETRYSGSDGGTVFSVTGKGATNGHVFVNVSGFNAQDRDVTIPEVDGNDMFRLKKVESPVTSKEPYSRNFTTGTVPSGPGANWSNWYTVIADPPLPGYVIDLNPGKTYYTVSGDRACESNPIAEHGWLNCKWQQQDAQQASFQFRLQGHNEWFPPGIGLSTGTLHVTYIPKS